MNSDNRPLLSVLLSALSVGSSSVLSKVALASIPPIEFTFFRFTIASVVLTLFLIKEKSKLRKPTLSVIFITLILTANPIFTAYGFRLTTATIGQTLFIAGPLVTALFSFLYLRQRIGVKKIIGLTCGFIGVLVIILLPVSGRSIFNGNVVGNIFVSISVVALALYSVLTKPLHNRYSPIYLTALFAYSTTLITFLLMLPDLYMNTTWIGKTTMKEWLSLLYVGIIGTLYFIFYQYAVKHASPLIASMTLYLSPLVTFIIASVLLGEQITTRIIIGAALALSGVYLVTVLSSKAQRIL